MPCRLQIYVPRGDGGLGVLGYVFIGVAAGAVLVALGFGIAAFARRQLTALVVEALRMMPESKRLK